MFRHYKTNEIMRTAADDTDAVPTSRPLEHDRYARHCLCARAYR